MNNGFSQNLNYHQKGSGIPLVFQHGLGADLNQVIPLLSGLIGVNLLTADMRGHGDTPYDPTIPVSFRSYAHDISALLLQLDINSPVCGGISMGSGIALTLAANHPQLVSGLVLVRPAWLFEGNPENLALLRVVAGLLCDFGGPKELERNTAFAHVATTLPASAASILNLFNAPNPAYMAEILLAMVGDYPIALSDIPDIPTLIIGNDDDPLHPWEMARAWHEQILGSTLFKVTSRYIDPAAHTFEVCGHIQEFLNKID